MIFDKYISEFRSMKVEDLQQVQSALDKALSEKQKEEIREFRDEMMRKAVVLGISVPELIGKQITKKRSPIEPKYRITDDDNNVHEWSGRGIKPKVFRNCSKEELEKNFRIDGG